MFKMISTETWDFQVFFFPAADCGLRFYNVDNAAEEEDDVDVISQLNAVFGCVRISISACV